MTAGPERDLPERIGFLLVPQFGMIAFFSAVEPLRVANRLSNRPLYSWHVYSEDGGPVPASNGMTLVAESSIAAVPEVSAMFVCASFDPERYAGKGLLAWLRRLARKGTTLGAVDTGAYILAEAGLLDGHRAALHWENLPAFEERFPEIETSEEIFEIGRGRLTCSGGTAALDMMLQRISDRHGRDLALAVSEQMLHSRIRSPNDHQRMTHEMRSGLYHPGLRRAVAAMERSLEDPLSTEALATLAGVSRRQLERLFRTHLGDTPTGHYLKLRLRRARQLLEQTEMSVLDVGLACGFGSAPYFSRAYRAAFGRAPRADRRALRTSALRTGGIAPAWTADASFETSGTA
jgi:AraC family carnitine catabolism transcriptional activator